MNNLNFTETFFMWFVSNIETIYIVYTSILVCWGLFIIYALNKTIIKIQNQQKSCFSSIVKNQCKHCPRVRFCDRIHLLAVLIMTIVNIFGLVATPILFLSFVDLLMVSNFWVTGYYTFIMCTSLKDWPILLSKNELRDI